VVLFEHCSGLLYLKWLMYAVPTFYIMLCLYLVLYCWCRLH